MKALNHIHSTNQPEREHQESHHALTFINLILWILGLIVLLCAAWIVHGHTGPWPFELTVSRDVQAWPLPGWLRAILIFISAIDDPIPSGIFAAILVVILLCTRKFRPALFIGFLILVGNSIDAIIGDIVGRPRPDPHLIHVTSVLNFNSFPSGHTEHIVIFYGFLLFLTLSKSVREREYAKWLIPLQVLMALDIILMGFSRVLEGEHWTLDVLSGYLSGVLWLTLFIFLYHRKWTRNEPGAWQQGKLAAKAQGT